MGQTYEQLCDEGRELERAEQCERAEQQIREEQQIEAEKQRRLQAVNAQLGTALVALSATLGHDRPTAAALALASLAEAHSEGMAHGRLCLECGEEFPTAQGRPARCTGCGGDVQVSPWYAGGRYFASADDAACVRERARDRRERYVRRVARILGEAR